MSSWDYLQDARAGIALLRRIEAGDETAFREIEPLLKRLDDRDAKHRTAEQEKLERSARRRQGDRKLSGRFKIAPSNDGGIAHSASGIILIEKGGTWLVWRSGGNYWSGRQQHYGAAELEIRWPSVNSQNRMPGRLTDNFNSGVPCKLSKALVLKYTDRIDEVFGAGAAAQAAELKGTVIL